MDNSWIDPVVWVVLGVVSLGALITGVGLVVKAFSFQSHYLVSSIIGILAMFIFTALGLLAPLSYFAGKQYQQAHLLADLLMFGISGLVVLGIVFFIIDHLQERPGFLMLAAATSLAIGIFPWIYLLYAEKLHQHFEISIVGPQDLKTTELDPLSGERGSLKDTPVPPQTSEVDSTETSLDPASRFGQLTPPPPISVQPPNEGSTADAADGSKGSSTDWLYDDP